MVNELIKTQDKVTIELTRGVAPISSKEIDECNEFPELIIAELIENKLEKK